MSARQKFETRIVRVVGEMQRQTVIALAGNIPVDAHKPVEVVFREPPKQRSLDANARMWVGPLKCIAEQAWLEGRQYSDETWHRHFKKMFLPDPDLLSPEELAKRVKNPETYRKWEIDPGGDRECVGSTTELTPFGFGEYLTQIEALAGELGVEITASPREPA